MTKSNSSPGSSSVWVCIRGSIYTETYHRHVLPVWGGGATGGSLLVSWLAWDGREAEECLDSAQMVYKQYESQLCHAKKIRAPSSPLPSPPTQRRHHLVKTENIWISGRDEENMKIFVYIQTEQQSFRTKLCCTSADIWATSFYFLTYLVSNRRRHKARLICTFKVKKSF